jgi:phosphoribosylformylglycinamidine (FGAM) synthase PurS component
VKDPGLALRVLNWVLEQQMQGKEVTSLDVAKAFEMSVAEAEALHQELEDAGEFE